MHDMSSQPVQDIDDGLNLFDVHGESPSPPPKPASPQPPILVQQQDNRNVIEKSNGTEESSHSEQTETKESSLTTSINDTTTNDDNNSTENDNDKDKDNDNENDTDVNSDKLSTSSLPFKASSLIRSLSDKLPQQINALKLKPKPTHSPVSSTASSPQPPLNSTSNTPINNNTAKRFVYLYM